MKGDDDLLGLDEERRIFMEIFCSNRGGVGTESILKMSGGGSESSDAAGEKKLNVVPDDDAHGKTENAVASRDDGEDLKVLAVAVEEKEKAIVCHEAGDDDNRDLTAECEELRSSLRLHAHQLLEDAGWTIRNRNRQDRNTDYFLFISPTGDKLFSLIKAWMACGVSMFGDGLSEGDRRQWATIDGFWSDLSKILVYVENEMQSEAPISLSRRWRLLNPFVSLACIKKKIGALRKGKLVCSGRGV
ncbi:hypothetical protein QJS10_CPA08g01198 [Acorus calamus]|uniref:DUF7028 domain-containing protein n=1 Tax=Acorus calamus TaxID=4465 RepID=A0AAV9E9Z3_ACOCL|nr:hypothetical protein QJS10_CPA08g01198 [Acorus calamus]